MCCQPISRQIPLNDFMHNLLINKMSLLAMKLLVPLFGSTEGRATALPQVDAGACQSKLRVIRCLPRGHEAPLGCYPRDDSLVPIGYRWHQVACGWEMSMGCEAPGCLVCFSKWLNEVMSKLTGYERDPDDPFWWKRDP